MLYGANACMCTLPRVRGAQLRRSQPAFIIVMVMKLVSVLHKGRGGYRCAGIYIYIYI